MKSWEEVRRDRYESLGGLLLYLRKHRRMTLRDAKEASDVPLAAISRIETGRTQNPGFWTVWKLFAAYGENISETSVIGWAGVAGKEGGDDE